MIRFDPYAVPPPPGEWEYIVHDRPIRRDEPGNPRLLLPRWPVARLGPDTEFRHWRNEYVLVHEDGEHPTLKISGVLYLTAHRHGADLLDFHAEVRDPAGEAIVTVIVAADCERQAVRKVRKVLEWYRLERDRRDKGLLPLLTASELMVRAPLNRMVS